ncbi:MAG: fibronectin type III domain-containing protein [Bacteroidales bacterium]
MKKITFLLLAMLMSTASISATTLSAWCDTQTGHDNEAEFGNPDGRVLLTIAKESDNSIAVTVKKSPDSSVEIDYLYVVVDGMGAYEVGTDEGALLNEYKAVITFDTAPETVTFNEIQWSNPSWVGRWMATGITVPFDAACDIDFNDDVKPVITKAELVSVDYTSATVALAATDLDNDNLNTDIVYYNVSDAANGVAESTLYVNANGEVTVTGLSAGTTYNLLFAAVDDAGNVSDNTISVEATTTAMPEVYIIDNFEGTSLAWEALEGSYAVSIVDNPDVTGINASESVLQGGRGASDNNWAAAMIRDLYIAGGNYKYLHVMMYRDVIGTVPNAKLSDTKWDELAPMNESMKAGEWQDVVFDISGFTSEYEIEFLYYMYDRGELSADAVIYIDDIVLSNDATERTAVSEGDVFVPETDGGTGDDSTGDVEYGEQYTIDDFEGGIGDWIPCEGSHDLYIVDNPDTSGINATANVLQGGRDSDANFWAAAMVTDLSVPGGIYNYLHVMMYRDVVADTPKVKFSDSLSTEFTPMNTMVAGEWQDVVFDISSFTSGNTIDFMYYMYDVGTLSANAVIYLDDIVLSNDSAPRTSATGVEAVEVADAATIYAANGVVYVKSTDAVAVDVYSLTGAVVASAKAVESATFTLPSGCYIVKAGATIKKVIL